MICFSIKNGGKFGFLMSFQNKLMHRHGKDHPFLSEDHKFLYYSTDISGNKDLYSVKVDLESRRTDIPIAIE
jgi:Tol biopolymer transport system component